MTDPKARINPVLTHERLTSVLHYDANTGIFTWLKSLNSRGPIGKIAGTAERSGRRKISIDGIEYQSSRLAWFYVHGVWPSYEIDHINGDPSFDAMCNLRDVPRAINQQNIRKQLSINRLGIQGVSKAGKKYYSRVQTNRQITHLGGFNTAEEAYNAYVEAKRRLHEGNTL